MSTSLHVEHIPLLLVSLQEGKWLLSCGLGEIQGEGDPTSNMG